MSSSCATVRSLGGKLTICSSVLVGNATIGKTGKEGVVVRRHPSLLFLSVRLPSVLNVELLDSVHRRIM